MKIRKEKRCFVSGSQIGVSKCDYRPESDLWPKFVHNHDYIEIAVVTNGVGRHKINNTSCTVKKGDVCIINTESIHCFTPCDDKNSKNLSISFIGFYLEFLYDIGFNPSLLNNIINMLMFKFYYVQENNFSFTLSDEELEHVNYLLSRMARAYKELKNGDIDMLKMYLCILLTEFSRCYSKIIETAPKIDNYHFSLVKNIIEYLGIHYGENIRLTDLSEYHHISSRHLSRIFKNATGLSIFEYLQKIRIEKACLLLNTTDENVTYIMSRVGFADYRHFSQIFKKYTGMTPRKYANKSDK